MYIRTNRDYRIRTKREIYSYYKFLLNKGLPWDLVAEVQNGIMFLTGKDKGVFIPNAYINGHFPNKEEQEKLQVAASFIFMRRIIYFWSCLFIWITFVLTCILMGNTNCAMIQYGYAISVLSPFFIVLVPYCITWQIQIDTDIVSIGEG